MSMLIAGLKNVTYTIAMHWLQKYINTPIKRYVVVGGSVYIFELLVIVVAQKLGASPAWAVGISFCLGTIVSFFLQKFLTFGDKRMQHKVLLSQVVATGILIAWNLAFSVILTKLLQNMLPAVATRTLALCITTIWNFYIYKTHIFRGAVEPV